MMPRFLLLASLLALSPGGTGLAQALVQQARPWLGVGIEDGKDGVRVKEVLADTPAAEYGLKAGDEITAIDKTSVKKAEELIRAVQAQGVGNAVVVHYLRAGRATSVTVKLKARPDDLEVVRKQLVGKPVPEFDLPVVSGKGPASSKALKGKVALIEFWATWCGACRSTHPRLARLAKEKPELNILTVSDEDEATQKSYQDLGKQGLTMLRDADHKLHAAWRASAIPLIGVVDKSGVVVFATIGAGEYLEEAIKAAEQALAAK